MNTKLLDMWNEIKVIVETLDVDAAKSVNGNLSAGVRVRKGLRLLKTKASAFVKESVEAGKTKE